MPRITLTAVRQWWRDRCHQFRTSQSGQTLVDYSVIAALIGLAMTGASGTLKSSLQQTFNKVAVAVSGTVTPESSVESLSGKGPGSGVIAQDAIRSGN